VDCGPSAQWVKTAVHENLEYQQAINESTGRDKGTLQPSAVASDGIEKIENGYSWTQTSDDLELIIPLPDSSISSRELKVKFNPRKVNVSVKEIQLLSIELFAIIDPEGCTWTMDSGKLIVSCEKVDSIMWPRVAH
jgi:hypothetical protein